MTDEELRKVIEILDKAEVPQEDRMMWVIVPCNLSDEDIPEYLRKALEREGFKIVRDRRLPVTDASPASRGGRSRLR